MSGGLMKRWWQARIWWRQRSRGFKVGIIIGGIAVAGLVWQHYTVADMPARQHEVAEQPNADEQAGEDLHAGHDHSGHAHGEYQPDPTDLPPPPDYTTEAARAITERFAANFGAPNGNLEDWLARITPDVSEQLAEQYRLTDIRNIPQATVVSVTGPVNTQAASPAFQVAYSDGSRVEIAVDMDIEGWKVGSVVPLDAATSPEPAAPPAAAPAPEGPVS